MTPLAVLLVVLGILAFVLAAARPARWFSTALAVGLALVELGWLVNALSTDHSWHF